ncbi:MAG: zinc-binding dehydrogenase, partial [Gammaproteobacteria bacterium]|nr:zinc-binding dehydrogenase [Gammaproteobacteria bacterium]
KNLTVRGIIVGSRRMFTDLIRAMVRNDIRPVIDRVFDWDDVYDAIDYMQSGEKIGKLVIRVT